MKNYLMILALMLIGNFALGQKFKDAESMIGHEVFFSKLSDYLSDKDFLQVYNDKGKLKPVKDISVYPELKNPNTIFSVGKFEHDGNKTFQKMTVGDKDFYFLYSKHKGSVGSVFTEVAFGESIERDVINNYYKYATDLTFYKEKMSAFCKSNCFIDMKRLGGNIFADSTLTLGRFKRLKYVDIVFGDGQKLLVSVKIGNQLLKIDMADLEKCAIPNSKINSLWSFKKKVDDYYVEHYRYIRVEYLKEKDNSKVLFGKFYPVSIKYAKADKDWNALLCFEIDGKNWTRSPENIRDVFVSEDTIQHYRDEERRLSVIKKNYSLFDGCGYSWYPKNSVRLQFAYYYLGKAFIFKEDGNCLFAKKAVIDTTELTNAQKNNWEYLRRAGMEAMSNTKQYIFPYELNYEDSTIKVDVSILYDESQKGPSFRTPRRFYKGPIFPEFTSYGDYCDYCGEIPVDLTKQEWQEWVWNATGSMPWNQSVTHRHSDNPKEEEKYIDPKDLKPQKHYWILKFNNSFTEMSFDGDKYQKETLE